MSLGEIATFSRWFALGNLAVGRGWCGVVSAATEWLVSPLTLLVVGSRLKESLASLDACVPVGGILGSLITRDAVASQQLLSLAVLTLAFMLIGGIDDWSSLTKHTNACLLYTSPSPRDRQKSRMPSSA